MKCNPNRTRLPG